MEQAITMRTLTIVAGIWTFAVLSQSTTGILRASEKYDFEPVAGFPQVPNSIELGLCSGVAVNSKGHVYLAHRGKSPIICFDSTGRYLRSWGDDSIGSAHGLRIDRDDNIWVTDIDKHVLLEFTSTGKLLLSLGQPGKAGLGNDQFDKPADVAFGAAGEIYVADGYGNSRVMKFAANGKFLTSWGKPGSGPGEFNLPHSIVTTSDGRVVVGDRLNKRVQVFNADGKLLEIWGKFTPFGLEVSRDGVLWVADGGTHQVLRLDGTGKVVQSWGKKGSALGEFDAPHMLAADAAGNLYIAEILNKRLQKLARKP